LIVNYDSGSWTLRCAQSLAAAWAREGRAAADLEIIVLDSGSNPAEATWWRSLRRLGVRVKCSPANVGYATGLNMAFELSSGAPDDVVALLNPDLYFLPGSLEPLLERLARSPGVGAVAPRLFLDEQRQLLLPQNLLPTPARELGEVLSRRWPRLARRLASSRSRLARRVWCAEEPQRVEMLSGACLFLRRSTVEHLGAPMDGRYPLYFEDADLCARLARAGYGLETVPRSEVLHHWSRCAGPHFEGEVARRHAFGKRLWLSLHHDQLGARLVRAAARAAAALLEGRSTRPMHALTDLGRLAESPVLEFASEGDYLLELSLTPWWGLAAGVRVHGDHYRLPAASWSWLYPGSYYLRALEASSGDCLGAWCFEKQSPARSWPLDAADLPGPRRRSAPRQLGERVG
jgi:GT2 family glycosyltransferase